MFFETLFGLEGVADALLTPVVARSRLAGIGVLSRFGLLDLTARVRVGLATIFGTLRTATG